METYLSQQVQALGASAAAITLSGKTQAVKLIADNAFYVHLAGTTVTASNGISIPANICVKLPVKLWPLSTAQTISVLENGTATGKTVTVVEILDY
jgi:hypothetical protein